MGKRSAGGRSEGGLVYDMPVPRLLHGLVRSFVDDNAGRLVKEHLANVKRVLENG